MLQLGDGSISLSYMSVADKGEGADIAATMTMDVFFSLNYLHHLNDNIYSQLQLLIKKIFMWLQSEYLQLLPQHRCKEVTQLQQILELSHILY